MVGSRIGRDLGILSLKDWYTLYPILLGNSIIMDRVFCFPYVRRRPFMAWTGSPSIPYQHYITESTLAINKGIRSEGAPFSQSDRDHTSSRFT